MLRISDTMLRLKCFYVFVFGAFSTLYLLYIYRAKSHSCDNHSLPVKPYGNSNKYSRFIFIGGVPGSGNTLMRALLDAHPHIRCNGENPAIPWILDARSLWKEDTEEWVRLQHAGVTDELLRSAIGSFIIQVTAQHSSAPRLCNKEPFVIKHAAYLSEIFPNSQYIFMIRDGRATVHNIISRKVMITDCDLYDYRQCMGMWNTIIATMDEECTAVGDKCLKVYYEQLVLHPESQMRRILDFLRLPWNENVLHHEEYIRKDISLSKVERSSDQAVKPVNFDALTKWVDAFPKDVLDDMDKIAPMLSRLGYDPSSNPPNYGKPDDLVEKKIDDVHMNGENDLRVGNDPKLVEKQSDLYFY